MGRMEDVLRDVQFVVNSKGKPTAAVMDIQTWKILLDWIEDSEDAQLARERLNDWATKRDWTPWESFEAELDGR